jgi:hypothetical protein
VRLTSDEIRLIVVILLALTVGATVKHYRGLNPRLAPEPSLPAKPVPIESAGY